MRKGTAFGLHARLLEHRLFGKVEVRSLSLAFARPQEKPAGYTAQHAHSGLAIFNPDTGGGSRLIHRPAVKPLSTMGKVIAFTALKFGIFNGKHAIALTMEPFDDCRPEA